MTLGTSSFILLIINVFGARGLAVGTAQVRQLHAACSEAVRAGRHGDFHDPYVQMCLRQCGIWEMQELQCCRGAIVGVDSLALFKSPSGGGLTKMGSVTF